MDQRCDLNKSLDEQKDIDGEKIPNSDSSNVSTPSLLLPNTDSFVLLQEYAARLIDGDSVMFENVQCSSPSSLDSNSSVLKTDPLKVVTVRSSTPISDLDATFAKTDSLEDKTLVPIGSEKESDADKTFVKESDDDKNDYSSDDYARDPSYKPTEEIKLNDSNDSIHSPPRKLHKSDKILKPHHFHSQDAPSQQDAPAQHCEFVNCISEVFSSCHKCLCLLCYEHFIGEVSYSDCKSHRAFTSVLLSDLIRSDIGRRQNSSRQTVNLPNIDKVVSNTEQPCDLVQHCEYEGCTSQVFSTCEICCCLLCCEHFGKMDDCNNCHKPFSSENQNVGNRLSKKCTAKLLRNTGQEYCNNKKKIVQPRAVRPPCNENCRLQCSSKFPESVRLHIFSGYWALGDINRQRDFIHKHTQEVNPKYRYEKTCCRQRNRKMNQAFFFTFNNNKIRVCKTFFKATLDINDRIIRTVFNKTDDKGIVAGDARGKHDNHPKKVAERSEVHAFIDSIPRIESHYLRAQTTKQFIDGGLTLTQLYNDYTKSCVESGKSYVSKTVFSQIFHNDFNISFFIPKKDLCELCEAYKNSEEKEAKKEEYEQHLKEKDLSREEKQNDKSKVSLNYVVACYDLQAVLPAPRGEISLFYYISKVATYNFTVTELKTLETSCYVWHEGQGNRGVTEIGSCVLSYLEEKSNACTSDDLEVVFYSDNCCGQQKNKFMIAMYIYAVSNFNIKTITHKFLIKGHTQSEGDSVHSVIEKQIKRALKSGPIYVPEDYVSLIKTAKKNPPYYKVKQLCYADFMDLKEMTEEIGNNFSRTDDNKIIKIQTIKVIKVLKDDPNCFYVKTSYEQTDFMRINLRRSRKQFVTPSSLHQAYTSKIPVCEKKKKAILKLIETNHIPRIHFDFYNSL